MKDAQKTPNSWDWWEKLTGVALTVERSGISYTLKLEPELLRKLPQPPLKWLESLIESLWSESHPK